MSKYHAPRPQKPIREIHGSILIKNPDQEDEDEEFWYDFDCLPLQKIIDIVTKSGYDIKDCIIQSTDSDYGDSAFCISVNLPPESDEEYQVRIANWKKECEDWTLKQQEYETKKKEEKRRRLEKELAKLK